MSLGQLVKTKHLFLIQTANQPGALINILRPFEKKED